MTEDAAARDGDAVVEAGAAAEDPPGIRFRRPSEADYPAIGSVIDEWWGGRNVHHLLSRLWLQHFTGTSWIAEDAGGAPMGFLVGFISSDHPDEAYIHMVATSPNHRKAGLGRALYERFFEDVRARGVRRVTAITWPANQDAPPSFDSLQTRLARVAEVHDVHDVTHPVHATPTPAVPLRAMAGP